MQMARNLADEFGPQGVRVNCIAPGLIKTDFARALWENPDTLEISTRRSSLRRIGEPEEIAGAAVFLASRAGGFTTGQTIVIDGGNTSSRSEEHTSELQSLMRISYAVFCLKKKNK